VIAIACLVALVLGGCRTAAPTSAILGKPSLIPCAREARREGTRLERSGVDASVDRYYEAAVFAAAAFQVASASVPFGAEDLGPIRDLYNESLGDCLRAAQRFGRLDARSSLLINAPSGPTNVPIRHVGFVWKPTDFDRVVHPCDVVRNPSAHASSDFEGVGAGVAVERDNPRLEPQDDFLPRIAVFNATALLRPDLDAWLGAAKSPPGDVLEFHDPLRSGPVSFGPTAAGPLRANLGVANARARQIQAEQGSYALDGFARPERMLDKADIRMLEPYQPGKPPLLLVHGLLDDPFLFNDMIIGLQRTPGFLEGRQIWVFRYPTGITFIRSASILRKQIEAIASNLDPTATDPALSDWTLVGYSMGGLLCRLQVSWSGEEVWNVVSNRPVEGLRMSDAARRTVRDLFFFEPSPRVGRVIFLATPHDGASPTIAAASWLATRVVQRPADTRELVEEVDRANPGALRPALRNIPSSVDALASYSPLLPAIRKLPYNPAVRLHTIAGTGLHSADRGRGDLVVPLTSAHVDEAESEHHVRATHSDIYHQPDTINEVRRILGLVGP